MAFRFIITIIAAWITMAAVTAQRNPEAAKLKSPVASTAESIEAGRVLYVRHCASCHGIKATGGIATDISPAAPDLTDAEWVHGDSEGEIFEVIKNGVPPDLSMPAWGDRLKDPDIWNVVNYVKSLRK